MRLNWCEWYLNGSHLKWRGIYWKETETECAGLRVSRQARERAVEGVCKCLQVCHIPIRPSSKCSVNECGFSLTRLLDGGKYILTQVSISSFVVADPLRLSVQELFDHYNRVWMLFDLYTIPLPYASTVPYESLHWWMCQWPSLWMCLWRCLWFASRWSTTFTLTPPLLAPRKICRSVWVIFLYTGRVKTACFVCACEWVHVCVLNQMLLVLIHNETVW